MSLGTVNWEGREHSTLIFGGGKTSIQGMFGVFLSVLFRKLDQNPSVYLMRNRENLPVTSRILRKNWGQLAP